MLVELQITISSQQKLLTILIQNRITQSIFKTVYQRLSESFTFTSNTSFINQSQNFFKFSSMVHQRCREPGNISILPLSINILSPSLPSYMYASCGITFPKNSIAFCLMMSLGIGNLFRNLSTTRPKFSVP